MSVEKHVTKHNKYVVNQKPEHVDDISFRELLLKTACHVMFYI